MKGNEELRKTDDDCFLFRPYFSFSHSKETGMFQKKVSEADFRILIFSFICHIIMFWPFIVANAVVVVGKVWVCITTMFSFLTWKIPFIIGTSFLKIFCSILDSMDFKSCSTRKLIEDIPGSARRVQKRFKFTFPVLKHFLRKYYVDWPKNVRTSAKLSQAI